MAKDDIICVDIEADDNIVELMKLLVEERKESGNLETLDVQLGYPAKLCGTWNEINEFVGAVKDARDSLKQTHNAIGKKLVEHRKCCKK